MLTTADVSAAVAVFTAALTGESLSPKTLPTNVEALRQIALAAVQTAQACVDRNAGERRRRNRGKCFD